QTGNQCEVVSDFECRGGISMMMRAPRNSPRRPSRSASTRSPTAATKRSLSRRTCGAGMCLPWLTTYASPAGVAISACNALEEAMREFGGSRVGNNVLNYPCLQWTAVRPAVLQPLDEQTQVFAKGLQRLFLAPQFEGRFLDLPLLWAVRGLHTPPLNRELLHRRALRLR